MSMIRPSLTRWIRYTAISAALVLAAPAGPIATAAEMKPLVHAIPNDINSLDPVDIKGQQDQEIGVNLYERLVQFKFNEQKDGTLLADRVREWCRSLPSRGPSRARPVTFKLRQGREVLPDRQSDDSRKTCATPSSAWSPSSATAKIRPASPASSRPIRSSQVDPYTVKITFMDGPNGKPTLIPVSVTSMKFQQFAIINSVEVKKHHTDPDDPFANKWLTNNVATTGPYYITNRIRSQQLDLKAVPEPLVGQAAVLRERCAARDRAGRPCLADQGRRRRLCGRGPHRSSVRRARRRGLPCPLRRYAVADAHLDGDGQGAVHRQAGAPGDALRHPARQDHQDGAGRPRQADDLPLQPRWISTCNNNYDKYKLQPPRRHKALLKEAGRGRISPSTSGTRPRFPTTTTSSS